MLVIPSIAEDQRALRLKDRVARGGGVIHAAGLWGSAAPMVAAIAAAESPRTFLFVTAHPEEAEDARDDVELFLGRGCELFPAWEALPGEGAGSTEIEAERLRLCAALQANQSACFLVAPIQALMQPVPAPSLVRSNTLTLTSLGGGTAISPDKMLTWAVDRDFDRLDMVESPGDVAQRGDLVDLFALGEPAPYRIQFYDDHIESIRRFDVGSQRSIETLDTITITAMPKLEGEATRQQGNEATSVGRALPAAREDGAPQSVPRPRGSGVGRDRREEATFLQYLPKDTVVILDGPREIQELGATLHKRLGDNRIIDVRAILAGVANFTQLHLFRFGAAAIDDEDTFDFSVASLARFEGGSAQSVTELIERSADHSVYVLCENEGERQRLMEMLVEQAPEAGSRIHLELGSIHRGFDWTASRTLVVAHHELFHRMRPKRRIRRIESGRTLDSWTDLRPGEYVVHVLHGIAVYRGLQKMRKGVGGQQEEFLTLEFDEGSVIHVPCSQIDLVQKYIGAGGRKPQLSRLGGKRWSNTKEKVADSVSDLAEALLRIQAARAQASGTAYPPETQWQREFEAAFLYEETEDQLIVAKEIQDDLTQPRPMDRLVCGDVGYGKTELAMRAAFKVVEYGKQVAVLVPTTVLAEQHFKTFSERMAEYPFSIGSLSRFRSPAEQRELVQKIKKGQVDIVIGTHRLLSKDIAFANLGLVVIDEEQRFGVEHKERLRLARESVDVLTLTATPIPRTLHMSLVGIRDISSLQTPPVDRRAIATQIRSFDENLIRGAILREMNRDGQVYFIHNFVHSIAAMADTVRRAVPEARVIYGHGQMKDEELEDVMHKFLNREADVLVATTIIESGIDIPSVNTIFINRADRFGLADLHQLRGRVGRSSHRAYCYLLLSPDRPVLGKAAKRLKAIEEFSELGAGFRIAMRDLEIRGAGNLLGREQSGHIAAVGYEMYCRLLEQTVRRLKNEPDPTPPTVHIDLDVAAMIPGSYITSDRARIEMYRRVVSCRVPEDLERLEKDLIDAFGPIPKPMQRLLELAELRVLARRFGITSISLQPPDVIFLVESVAKAQPAFKNAPGTVRMPDAKTIHLRLPPAYLEPTTLVPVLRRMFQKAAALPESVA